MAITNYLPQSPSQLVFNPTPTNDGVVSFSIDNLLDNSLTDNDSNLFKEFYNKTYCSPLETIFGTKEVLNFKVNLESRPSEDGAGRSLYYSKEDFFEKLIELLLSDVDVYGLTSEEVQNRKNELYKNLQGNKNNPTDLNLIFSNYFKERERIFRELKDNEFGSQRYDALLKYFSKYEGRIDYKEFLDMQYDITCKLQTGLLKLSNFFDRKVDYEELSKCFSEDKFSLLFAKVIEDSVLKKEDESVTSADYNYLIIYRNALEKELENNPNYSVSILDNEKEKYNQGDFLKEMNTFLEKYPDNGSVNLYYVNSSELYDQSLAASMYELYDNQQNYTFLSSDIPASLENRKRIESLNEDDISDAYLEKENREVVNTNKRIGIIKELDYIGYPLKGKNGYYAFIFANGKVLLEKFWDNEELFIPSTGNCAYVMNIDKFITMSKQSNVCEGEYLKNIIDEDLQRVFLDDLEGYERVIKKIIKGEGYYDNNYAFDYLNSLDNIEEAEYAK